MANDIEINTEKCSKVGCDITDVLQDSGLNTSEMLYVLIKTLVVMVEYITTPDNEYKRNLVIAIIDGLISACLGGELIEDKQK